ncbi:MAG: hypothetical protein Q4F31_10815, partial [Eubacteriales bacterium]|nr:hypothetical protein [Eubacteriales bacterium]
EKGTQNRVLYEGENEKDYNQTAFLKKIGFTEVQYIESYKEKAYSTDSNDSATLLLAHTTVTEKYDLYVVALRGCFSVQEWISAFDPGFDGETYTNLTGQHPEWTDKAAFKGLDVAKNRALEFIDEFIAQNDNPNRPNCILITGHSRGGALANMIGAEMEDRKDIRSYTYTFSTPGVTTNGKAGEYRTIFNIIDANDYFTDPLPFGEEAFYRYGRDKTAVAAESDEILAEIARLKGREDFTSLDGKTKAEFAQRFGQRFPNRASLYDIEKFTLTFDSKEEASARTEEYLSLIGSDNGLGLEGLCRIECSENEGKYEVTLYYCGGAVLIAYAKSLAYDQAASEAAEKLFENDAAACEILALLMDHSAGISGGHLLINSFTLSKFGSP